MKIEDCTPDKGVELYEVDYGECFMYDGNLYLKTRHDMDGNYILCVSMEDSDTVEIPGFYRVEPVRAKVVIE